MLNIINFKKSFTLISCSFLLLGLSACNSAEDDGNVAEPVVIIETITDDTTDNTQPTVSDSQATARTNDTVTIRLIASDADNDTLTFKIESSVDNGSLTLTDNVATYVPNNNFSGSDSFTFSVNDGTSDSNIATVHIDVLALNEITTLVDGSEVETSILVNLGNLLYHDANLSEPAGQSCASCHDINTGFDDPNSANPTSVGADGVSFGTRNSPTASYAAHIPAPTIVQGGGGRGDLIGGLFLDGRAASLEEQAKGPFLNVIEMGNASEESVIEKVANSTYALEFEGLFGEDIFTDSERTYNYVADAIAAFERTRLFSPFSSKFDRVQAGTETFTAAETRGQNIFNNKGDCQRCHHSNEGAEIFSDFTYKNIGVPSNPILPAFIADPTFVDLGLGGENGNERNNGEFRTSTLRNITNTAPYMHNGVFTTLREVIDFYNTRDTTFNDEPEVIENMDQGGRLGELGLNNNEIEDLLAFLATLTDE
ncbi:MAG: cadherin-like domain-containing protein [Colwellia sp.]|nr:cadherin-like domain-containing protein [Colwellia sp.]